MVVISVKSRRLFCFYCSMLENVIINSICHCSHPLVTCAGITLWHDLHGATESGLEAVVQIMASHAATDVLRRAQENSDEYVWTICWPMSSAGSETSQGLYFISQKRHALVHVHKQVSSTCMAVRKVATLLRELTCHVGSHSVTCHPAEVTFPPLPSRSWYSI